MKKSFIGRERHNLLNEFVVLIEFPRAFSLFGCISTLQTTIICARENLQKISIWVVSSSPASALAWLSTHFAFEEHSYSHCVVFCNVVWMTTIVDLNCINVIDLEKKCMRFGNGMSSATSLYKPFSINLCNWSKKL